MLKYLLIITFCTLCGTTYGALAGGRLNAFSEGQNAFAGVVNPANAVWIADRFDLGGFWVRQNAYLKNKDNNPFFPQGKIDLTYHSKNEWSADAALHKHFNLKLCTKFYDCSVSLALYSLPSFAKIQTKTPLPLSGTTPIKIRSHTNVFSIVYSLKLNSAHSIGISLDYFRFSLRRDGFQHSDNPLRSVSPGHVTNNGTDHSNGVGFSLGWRWKITEALDFGAAWAKKSYCGQFRKYRGYEPHHAENYIPQSIGAGLSYRFTSRIAGRLEILWMNLGNLPAANNNVLPDGTLNLHKRGSRKSPGPGLQDATFINIGLGYKVNEILSVGAGLSHRIKLHRKNSNFISHTYKLYTTYDTLSLGANITYQKHNLFLGFSYGFRNRVSGLMPTEIGGGRFVGIKEITAVSVSWGYQL